MAEAPPRSPLQAAVVRAVNLLAEDLRQAFGSRLRTLVVHGTHARASASERPARTPINTLALIDSDVQYADLARCAERADEWRARGLAMPLLLSDREFARSLDAFPLEYGDIIAHHVVVVGEDPFATLRVSREDLRRGCEVQVKSHVIHLREGFLETAGEAAAVRRLLVGSASPFAALLGTLARLDDVASADPEAVARHLEARTGLSASVAARVLALERDGSLTADQAAQLYPPYLELVQELAVFVDSWTTPPGR